MKIINKAARLITFKFKGESYKLMPAGEAVEVPDKAKDESQFLKTLLQDGAVAVVDSGDVAEDGEEGEAVTEVTVDQLREDAVSLGIDVDNRWGESRLKQEIEKAMAE